MTDPPDAAVPTAPPAAPRGEVDRDVSDLYKRTWELELLIAGAVTFALIQLPSEVDRWFGAVEPTLDGGSRMAVVYAYEYAKFTLYVLITAFVVHLTARAYWVGLIGLDATFPHGVRWDHLPRGPITREAQRRRQPSLEAQIARTDRFCSVIFSFAFSIVFIFLLSVAGLIVLGGVTTAISRVFFDGQHGEPILFTIAGLLVLPPLILAQVDRRMGHRLDPDRGLGRIIRRYMTGSFSATVGAAYTPIFNVLASNLPRRAFTSLFYGAFLALIAFFMVKDVFLPTGAIRLGDYAYLPDRAGESTVDPAWYADEGAAAAAGLRRIPPQIQSMIVEDAYVRLFIPYLPRRHNEAIARECPGVRPLGGTGLRWVSPGLDDTTAPAEVEALFACLRRVQPVAVNGTPVREPYHLHFDRASGLRGVLVMLPTDDLPEGRNLLTVGLALRDTERDDPPPPYRIPFWVDHDPRGPRRARDGPGM